MEERSMIPAGEVSTTEHKTKYKEVNKHVSKVVMALIRVGHWNFKVSYSAFDRFALVENIPSSSRHYFIRIWSDGFLEYCSAAGRTNLEGSAKSVSSIIKQLSKTGKP